jgi:hypothetical protein
MKRLVHFSHTKDSFDPQMQHTEGAVNDSHLKLVDRKAPEEIQTLH